MFVNPVKLATTLRVCACATLYRDFNQKYNTCNPSCWVEEWRSLCDTPGFASRISAYQEKLRHGLETPHGVGVSLLPWDAKDRVSHLGADGSMQTSMRVQMLRAQIGYTKL